MIFFCKKNGKGIEGNRCRKSPKKMIFFDEIIEGARGNPARKVAENGKVRVNIKKVRVNWAYEGPRSVKNVKVRVSP